LHGCPELIASEATGCIARHSNRRTPDEAGANEMARGRLPRRRPSWSSPFASVQARSFLSCALA